MATHYIQKYASTADFLAASVDNGTAEGFGVVSDVLYQNIGGAAFAINGKSNAVSLVTTRTVLASENGKTFYLNLAAGFVTTLPAPALGLKYTFIVGTAPSGGSYTVVSAGSSNIIKGLQNSVAGDAGDSGTADDTISFVDGQALPADKVTVESDGTSWFAYAISKVAAGITFTQAS
jgi:hypothetical protein